jgi:hypothetical protein
LLYSSSFSDEEVETGFDFGTLEIDLAMREFLNYFRLPSMNVVIYCLYIDDFSFFLFFLKKMLSDVFF